MSIDPWWIQNENVPSHQPAETPTKSPPVCRSPTSHLKPVSPLPHTTQQRSPLSAVHLSPAGGQLSALFTSCLLAKNSSSPT